MSVLPWAEQATREQRRAESAGLSELRDRQTAAVERNTIVGLGGEREKEGRKDFGGESSS